MTGLLTIGVLGVGLSVDAFAAAIGKGAVGRPKRFRDAARIGAVFGVFEAITPLLGWAVGLVLSRQIAAYDHWVAFLLLAAVGGNMLWQALRPDHPDEAAAGPAADDGGKAGRMRLMMTALATSIDAAAVGVSLAVLDVNILVACLVIGGVTTLVATAGVLLGRKAGPYLGRHAELLGGIALIAIGGMILHQHLIGAA